VHGVGDGRRVGQPPGPSGQVVVDDDHLDPWVVLQDLQHDGGQVVSLVLGRHVPSALFNIGDGLSSQLPLREASSATIGRRLTMRVVTTSTKSARRAIGFTSITSRSGSPLSPRAATPEKVAT